MGLTNTEMAVVAVTHDTYETIRKTVDCFRSQSEPELLELVLVGPYGLRSQAAAEDFREFGHVRIVETDQARFISAGRAAGIRAAISPVVLLTEDHAYPDSEMTAALCNEFRNEIIAGAGPIMMNANSASFTSWANLILAHGKFISAEDAKDVAEIPWHNSAYKKDALLAVCEDLESALENEGRMQERLRKEGACLVLSPGAKTFHLNISKPASFIVEQFNAGRFFASTRRETFSGFTRMLYLIGSPLIPVKRAPALLKFIRNAEKMGAGRLLPGVLPAMLLGLCVHSLGEAFGYGLGAGKSKLKSAALEYGRLKHLSKKDLNYLAENF